MLDDAFPDDNADTFPAYLLILYAVFSYCVF